MQDARKKADRGTVVSGVGLTLEVGLCAAPSPPLNRISPRLRCSSWPLGIARCSPRSCCLPMSSSCFPLLPSFCFSMSSSKTHRGLVSEADGPVDSSSCSKRNKKRVGGEYGCHFWSRVQLLGRVFHNALCSPTCCTTSYVYISICVFVLLSRTCTYFLIATIMLTLVLHTRY